MFAVVITGAPGAGKTVVLTALSDALVDAKVAHAAIDVDEVAWAYPFPSEAERSEYLRATWERHRRAGRELLLVAEAVASEADLKRVLAAVGADDHLLVRLDTDLATLRERILAREPEGWFGLEHILAEAEHFATALATMDGAPVVVSTERLSLGEVVQEIRRACPERLGG